MANLNFETFSITKIKTGEVYKKTVEDREDHLIPSDTLRMRN